MSLDLYSELELTPENKSKSQQICLLVILALLMYNIGWFEYLLPIPIGMAVLYIFKEFGRLAAKSLIFANLLQVLFVLSFFEIYFLINVGIGFLFDICFISVYIRNDFKFDNIALLQMGIITAIPVSILFTPIMLGFPQMVVLFNGMEMVYQIIILVGVMVFVGIISGLMYVVSFRLAKEVLHNLFDMDEIKLV